MKNFLQLNALTAYATAISLRTLAVQENCPPGTYDDLVTDLCEPCPAGYHCNGIKAICFGGYYSLVGSADCTLCPEGCTSEPGAGECDCPVAVIDDTAEEADDYDAEEAADEYDAEDSAEVVEICDLTCEGFRPDLVEETCSCVCDQSKHEPTNDLSVWNQKVCDYD